MEAELDATLGYEKNHKGDLQTDNKRKWSFHKELKKASTVNSKLMYQETVMGSLNRS